MDREGRRFDRRWDRRHDSDGPARYSDRWQHADRYAYRNWGERRMPPR
jgi:hypothetical protein